MSTDRPPSPSLTSVPSCSLIGIAATPRWHSNSPPHESPPSPPLNSPPTPPSKQCKLAMEFDFWVLISERNNGWSIEDADKYNLIINHLALNPTDVFPSRNSRRFQFSWLTRFNWLRYSKYDNGGYCLTCVLFVRAGLSPGVDPGALVCKPFVNFRRATELLGEHAKRQYHKATLLSMEAFQGVMSQEQPSLAHQMDTACQQLVDKNWAKFRSIVETVLLCGRQNISLRGHRDSSLDVEKSPNAPHGNFWALLDFRVSAGDTVLKDHLAKASAHAKYTSPAI